MNPSTSNYSWSNTTQWSQVGGSPSAQPQGGNSSSTTANTPNYSTQSNQITAPIEPRTDMITRLYRTILGREPDQAGLNYYLFNTQIPELQIAREMIESTEHNDILAKARDIREMIKKTEEATKGMADMEFTLQSLQNLSESYKNLIDQKTQIINDLRGRLGITNENSYDNQEVHYSHQSFQSNSNQNNPQFSQESDFLLNDPFANESENRIGCINWIKSWFKFN
jgi:Domain of unknown function (DUF4214)